MVEEQKKETEVAVNVSLEGAGEAPAADTKPAAASRAPQRERNARQRNTRRQSRRSEWSKSAFDQHIISIRRVARVVAGGRRFSFSVAMVIGDRKGSVAVGLGKGSDTALAIGKALNDAKKNVLKLKLTKDFSLGHDVAAKYAASHVIIIPTPGRGLTAGSSVRYVLELAGVRNVSAKILSRSKNQLNNARAAVKALTTLSS